MTNQADKLGTLIEVRQAITDAVKATPDKASCAVIDISQLITWGHAIDAVTQAQSLAPNASVIVRNGTVVVESGLMNAADGEYRLIPIATPDAPKQTA